MSSTIHVFFSSDGKTKLQNSDFYQYVWVCYLVKKKITIKEEAGSERLGGLMFMMDIFFGLLYIILFTKFSFL